MTSVHRVLAVDLGKTRCRMLDVGRGARTITDGSGAPGLAAAGGVDAALAAILAVVQDTASVDGASRSISVGAAGAWAAPEAADALASRLRDTLSAPAAVTSDVVSAHVGALHGGEGVLLIAGTGAAALGVDGDGIRLVDGWGPELGDFGGGSWFGREALRAVLRAAVGLGPHTSLTDALREPVGSVDDVQRWLASGDALARRLASLAPLVLDAAAGGDPRAAEIADDAVRLLVASATAASTRSRDVALHGGLTAHDWFRERLESALRAAGRTPVAPLGDALEGALMIADRVDLPHERFVHRAG
ncbi:N-acetylglucosamine kinase [Microbacterium sp. NPDC089695]|uniref:N-acetylglucosamine kinase n=1 Tax=Microbacterium sp. NPDC089695 TaxID=3364198 RepID=UPI00380AFB48